MNVLMLGPHRPYLVETLTDMGDHVVVYEKRLDGSSRILKGVHCLVSYGYRYILKRDVLLQFPQRAVNLHISYLPWNRGADPNLWSILEDTPKGVTIHYMNEGLDTGEILAQKQVELVAGDTLRTSYDRLTAAIEELFLDLWPRIRSGHQPSIPQPPGGSYHKSKDRAEVEHLLYAAWDTPISDLLGKVKSEVAET